VNSEVPETPVPGNATFLAQNHWKAIIGDENMPLMTFLRVLLAAGIGLLLAVAQTSRRPPDVPVRGVRNSVYGYQVIVPKPHVAYADPTAMSMPHGLSVMLSAEDDAKIIVWAEYSPYSPSGEKLRTMDLAMAYSLRTYASELSPYTVERQTDTSLAQLAAKRSVLKSSSTGTPRILDLIVALRNSEGLLYELMLRTTPARYGADRIVFDQLASSFTLIKTGNTLKYLH
jgi:hypothetical protein